MCGICGVMRVTPPGPVEKDLLVRMRDTMTHRGPDDEGVYVGASIGLGHRRLSIIDLEGGHQPMPNADGTVWITYNGEIYNFRELRTLLEARGYAFRTKSDTEVIVRAYEEFGEACVDYFRGMFAFAIWDERKKQLFLARDRLGIKPLYYAIHDGYFLFASEIKAILQHPGIARRIDDTAVWQYLGYRYVPGPRTMFKDIWKLQPGHTLTVRNGAMSSRQYWDLPLDGETASESEAAKEFIDRLSESIRLRLISDVPLGVFLSGGLDSSTMTALMAGMITDPVESFCVGYRNGGAADERSFARLTAEKFGTIHRERVIEPEAFWEFLPSMVWFLDEPVADDPAVSLFFLSEFAKQFVTVILSGEGADEILAGYGIYQTMLRLEKFQWLSGLSVWLSLLGTHRAHRNAEWIGRDLEKRYRGISSIFTMSERKRLTNGAFNASDDIAARYFERTRGFHPLQRMLYFDTKVWLPDDLLVKADKMTMAASIELRVPFLDHKFVEWAWRLPPSLKLNSQVGKYVMRRAVEGIVPRPVMERQKFGFAVPVGKWFQAELVKAVQRLLVEEDSLDGLLNRGEMSKLLRRHEAGREDLSDQLFTLVVLALWYRIFIRPSVVSAPTTACLFQRP